jgi:hypothetical protein
MIDGGLCRRLANAAFLIGVAGTLVACSKDSKSNGAGATGGTGGSGASGGSGAGTGGTGMANGGDVGTAGAGDQPTAGTGAGGSRGGSGGSGTGGSGGQAKGGSSSSGKGGSSSGGTSAGGSAGDPPTPTDMRPECPASAPKNGASCSADNVQCQYGTDPRRACRPVATCKSGQWSVKVGTSAACPPLADTDCPSTPAELADARCVQASVPESGPYCAYNDVTCACDVGTCDATDCAWYCDPPLSDPDCPWGQPNVGTSCASNGLVCRYTTCVDHKCTGGYWTATDNGSCPMTPFGK